MDLGFYINLFEVSLPDAPVELMRVDRSKYSDLRKLRQELDEKDLLSQVYSSRETIYGYGEQSAEELVQYGFAKVTVPLQEIPEVTSHMVLEGFVAQLATKGYQTRWQKGRVAVFDYITPISIAAGARLYKGYDLRTLFLKDPIGEDLLFGIIVDIIYAYTDSKQVPLNTHELVARFGSGTLSLFRQKQGDLLPNRRINLEVSRQRLNEQILPFMRQHGSIILPCGGHVTVASEPVRVVLSGDEQHP